MARKQYYSRLNHLINAGLVTRKSGKYFLTSSGKEVYELRILIGQAVENYWKLEAIDSIESQFQIKIYLPRNEEC
jgi:Mn-dependent DtxR family transcriptional regulator